MLNQLLLVLDSVLSSTSIWCLG